MFRKKRKRKRKKSKHAAQNQVYIDPSVPTHDYFEYRDPADDIGHIDEILDSLIDDIKTGYFLLWEAVARQEQGLRLTRKHKKALSRLISFRRYRITPSLSFLQHLT